MEQLMELKNNMKIETLEDVLNRNGSDKGTKNRVKHSYANFYDQFLRLAKSTQLDA
jgi:hypothetical protein